MSVDAEKIDTSKPKSDEEKLWLQDRGLLEGDPVPVTFKMPSGDVVSNDPAHFATLQLNNDPAFQDFVERRAQEIAAAKFAEFQAEQLANANVQGEDTGTVGAEITTGTPMADDEGKQQKKTLDDVELPQGEPDSTWTNAQLRKELKDRQLDFSKGTNEELLARLAAQ